VLSCYLTNELKRRKKLEEEESTEICVDRRKMTVRKAPAKPAPG
jgi:hypothetical protein